MIQVLKYFYSRVYYFNSRTLDMQQNAYLSASAAVGFLLAFNLLFFLSPIFIIFNIGFFGMLYPSVGVAVVVLVVLYLKRGNRYMIILKDVEGYENDKRNKLKVYNLIYVTLSLLLFALFNWTYYKDFYV